MLPDRNLAEALEIADRLRLRIERELNCEGITASFGVSNFPQHGREPKLLLGAADDALYVSKRAGRNRVCKAGLAEVRLSS